MSSIKLEKVSYRYSPDTPFEKEALKDVTLEFKGDRITGLIGHTGSGKSTVAQLLNGLLRPTEGRVLLDGKDIWENPKEIGAVRFRVGLVFQSPEHQLFEETVYKDIAFGPTNMGLSPEEIDRKVREAAEFTGISAELLDKSPFELSGGQKRRAAIAGVIAMRPEITVLDEPAAGLDPRGREEILGRIRDYQRQTKTSVILISHSMEDMAVYADELVVMNRGSVLAVGSVDSVFRKAEAIEGSGLAVPQITRLMRVLRERGFGVDTGIYTVPAAKDEILKFKKA